jgi:hypothetical protein
LKDGNKSDRIDARKLAELLRGNQLHPVYHKDKLFHLSGGQGNGCLSYVIL